MKLASILPVKYLYLEEDNDYHMALAHLVPQSTEYANFFRRHATMGDHVIMDNGVVEGARKSVPELIAAAETICASEVILPDEIGDTEETLDLGSKAVEQMLFANRRLMAVPQGDLAVKWSQCLYEMLTWPIATIGITKFIYRTTGLTRADVIGRWGREIIDAGKQIHLLGASNGADEIRDAPLLVRGADTGYPAICAMSCTRVRRDGLRPNKDVEIDFIGGNPDRSLMEFNYRAWRRWTGIA